MSAYFTCDQVVDAIGLSGNHCNSCHIDAEDCDYPLCEIVDDGDVNAVDWAGVCCAVSRELDDVPLSDAQIITCCREALQKIESERGE